MIRILIPSYISVISSHQKLLHFSYFKQTRFHIIYAFTRAHSPVLEAVLNEFLYVTTFKNRNLGKPRVTTNYDKVVSLLKQRGQLLMKYEFAIPAPRFTLHHPKLQSLDSATYSYFYHSNLLCDCV